MKITTTSLLSIVDNVDTYKIAMDDPDGKCGGPCGHVSGNRNGNTYKDLEVPRLYKIVNVSEPLYWSRVPTWVEPYLEPPPGHKYITKGTTHTSRKMNIDELNDATRAITSDLVSHDDEYVPFNGEGHNHSGPSYDRWCCTYPDPIQRPQGHKRDSTTKSDASRSQALDIVV
ncbi:hypothetical protein K474DRAFT_1707670 [Panus rudis PR-1116 ss-1]|nr:hypothetical protein K474DRAFT_1707670 [Panus rudis PR-1116 ss-1]